MRSKWFYLGALLQGLILGLLLGAALSGLLAEVADVRLFRYQAF